VDVDEGFEGSLGLGGVGVDVKGLSGMGMSGGSSGASGNGRKREKAFRCPKFGCTKSYLNPNGLKYHVEKGTCSIDINLKLEQQAAAAAIEKEVPSTIHHPDDSNPSTDVDAEGDQDLEISTSNLVENMETLMMPVLSPAASEGSLISTLSPEAVRMIDDGGHWNGEPSLSLGDGDGNEIMAVGCL